MKLLIFAYLLSWSQIANSKTNSHFLYNRKKVDRLVFTATGSPVSYTNALVLLVAYDKLGIGLEFKEMSHNNSFQFTNSGRFDGEVARHHSMTTKKPLNTLKVNVPLHIVHVASMSYKENMSDNWKEFENRSICHLYGLNDMEAHIKDYYRIPVKDFNTCFLLVRSKQVDFTFLPRLEGELLNSYHKANLFLSKSDISSLPSYHHLHKKHSKTAKRVYKILQTMAKNGDIDLIKAEAKKSMQAKANNHERPYCFKRSESCFDILDTVVPKLSNVYKTL